MQSDSSSESAVPEPSQPLAAETILADTVIRNIGQLITISQQPVAGATGPLRIIENAVLAVRDGNIIWLGPDGVNEPQFQVDPTETARDIAIIDAEGAVITPGLVDSHTHLVFAGDRAAEFQLLRDGTSYQALLQQGRGTLTTVAATREADTDTLLALAQQRLKLMRGHGTTTVEIKTGYGLDKVTEEASLRIINMLIAQEGTTLSQQTETRIVPTFFGAHYLPPEYQTRRAAYIDLLTEEMLPSFVGMARFCDVACDRDAFTPDECRRILTRARDLGYQLKVHADQFQASGGARLAAELGAISADHLDHIDKADIAALHDAGVVATLLPATAYTLRTAYPSARLLLDGGVPVALATNLNPGTSYCENLQTIISLAMAAMGMTLEEALTAATFNGARALGLQDEIGSIEVGKRCELAVWSVKDYREIGYHFGINLVQSVLVQH